MSSGYHCWLDTLWFYCPFNYSRHVSHPKVDSFMSFFPVERSLHRLLGFNLVARHFGKMKIRDQFPIHLIYYTGYTQPFYNKVPMPCHSTSNKKSVTKIRFPFFPLMVNQHAAIRSIAIQSTHRLPAIFGRATCPLFDI